MDEYTDEDMAAVGRALMKAIVVHAYPGWCPADCPSEIVGDLRNECDELRGLILRASAELETVDYENDPPGRVVALMDELRAVNRAALTPNDQHNRTHDHGVHG
jgi:hypothetical protein